MSATALAHGVHYAVLAVGAGGLAALLAPRYLPHPTRPRDAHEARVAALRASLAGPAGPSADPAAAPHLAAAGRRPHDPALAALAAPAAPTTPSDTATRLLLPLAVIGSAAAAGVHTAVGPAHFHESTLFGLFFALSALGQVLWAVVASVACSRAVVLAGAVGNTLCLLLWAVTRTYGLPFGLMDQPEAVGPWDLACGAWEVLAVVACLALLRYGDRLPRRLPEPGQWAYGVPLFALASVAGLVALSLSGAAA